MTLQKWQPAVNGKGINVDGAYGNQCWDLSAHNSMNVRGVPSKYSFGLPTGNGRAAGAFYNFPAPLSRYYTRVFNNPNNPNQLPPVGAIMFWKYSLPGSYNCGHTGVVLSRNLAGFVSEDQNWGGAYAHKVRHNWNYVAGWFVRK